ncbi:MAG: TAXI family TRAP transporter solute-binding subunit [Oscillospiraceae bacterium]|jgi:TRAP transporter TAXI family solute receptor|nr:TAXI family TRAP transporter solute-binding subunit [Oscillospiraceae bacterium]MCM0705224.1 TAXI family TRAP transporter solute-binding subunit [Faecalicatena sp. BF-R-105]MDY3219306.1 TAXI family TRAP transporter solute-binding subunit [Candidatus Fimivivens sp.]GKH51667.1 C4-dicarboxylate ABC transporter [Eubacteriales bacterium]GKH64386.1 C4-dicarboxylate ABC transporter [Eubacteriales bacterium]
MKRIFALVMAGVMILGMTSCGSTPSAPASSASAASAPASSVPAEATGLQAPSSPYTIQICGATSGGTYFLIANGLCQLLNDTMPEWFQASAQSTGGTPDNIRLMEAGETDFAFGQAGVVKQALDGVGAFEGEKFQNIASVTYMYPNVMQIAVSNKSGIEDFSQIKGNTFCAGASGSATELNTRDMFAACGMTYNDAKMEYTSESQSVELMKNGQAQAANLVAAIGAASVTELYSTGDYHLISFTDEQLDEILKLSDSYFRYTIPAGTYANQNEDIHTFAIANYIFCRADLEEDVVYQFVKCMYDNLSSVEEIHSIIKGNVALENVTYGMTAPMHPGAEKYFKEVGAL